MKTTGTNPDIEILFEDNHLLAVNKPPGVLSQEDHSGDPDLLSLGKRYLQQEYSKKGNAFLGLLHRLDKPVSGVMLFAKTSKAASRISEQIRKRTVKKTYTAIVEGIPPQNGLLSDHLLKDKKSNRVSVVPPHIKQAKKAELIYETKQVKNNLSMLHILLITGRAHQIRVQLSHSGYPIVNDRKYGSADNGSICLHATEFTFNHPTLKKEITIRADLPTEAPWSFFK